VSIACLARYWYVLLVYGFSEERLLKRLGQLPKKPS
jgi:hypothetical protein